jgi:two-component system, OmpR family, phosphate regulon sensor histidine kinase PhoR
VRRSRFSLRLLAYVSLLLVTVGSISWAIADLAAGRELARADASLDATLRDVVAEYNDAQRGARDRALTLARARSVQRALAGRDAEALRRLRRTYPEASFIPASASHADRPTGQAVRVLAGGRAVGEVVLRVPFDRSLLQRLRRDAVVPPRDVLVLTTPNRVLSDPPGVSQRPTLTTGEPANVEDFRGLQAPLQKDSRRYGLAVLRPSGPITASVEHLRDRVLYAGLAAFLAVAIVGYAAAPAIGRTRLARERRAQAARILSQVRDGVVLVDEGGVVRSWNHGAEVITGIREESVLGRPPPRGFAALTADVPVATGPEDAAKAVTAPLRLDDRELWLSISAVGSEDGTVYAFRDLTDQRKLEQMRSEFVATVSHELRTPLASIYGAAMTLRDRTEGSDLQRQLLSIVTGESERLVQIVGEILLASELTSGELALRLERVDAAGIAERAVEAARPRLPDNLSLELATADELPPVNADEAKARQVLVNLIDNAVKYSPAGGRIELRIERQNGYVQIAVKDEGLGIPPAEQEHIFEKFYRLDPDMARGVGGTGLGLYICRELAERMGGRVHVRSWPGVGSTFYFELPVFA